MADYTFAPGVSGCIADGRLVVLNTRRDRYLMFPPPLEASLFRLLQGQPETAEDRAMRDRLCRDGLVLQRAPGSHLVLCEFPEPTDSLIDAGWRRPRAVAVAAAALRVLKTMMVLRLGGLKPALDRLAPRCPAAAPDTERARGLAASFAELRLVLRSLDRCLPLSIALAAASRRHDAQVRLVLGVQCNPFAAHAWVQRHSTVLNDRLEPVRAFTPILVL